MTTKFETLKQDLMTARKTKNKEHVRVLSVLLGTLSANAEMKEGVKVVTDDQTNKAIKKQLKGVVELLSYKHDDEALSFEKEYLTSLLPAEIDNDQLANEIQKIVNGGAKNIGEIMGQLKKTGMAYDASFAASTAKAILNGSK